MPNEGEGTGYVRGKRGGGQARSQGNDTAQGNDNVDIDDDDDDEKCMSGILCGVCSFKPNRHTDTIYIALILRVKIH